MWVGRCVACVLGGGLEAGACLHVVSACCDGRGRVIFVGWAFNSGEGDDAPCFCLYIVGFWEGARWRFII